MSSTKKSPFDFVKSIQNKKEYYDDIQGYSNYIVSIALSSNPAYIQAVNMMNHNGFYSLSPRAQYDFYYYYLSKTHKFHKFPKASKNLKIIEHIKTYFNVNDSVAKQYIELLKPEEIDEIRSYYEDHGKK